MIHRDYYLVLGVSRTAEAPEIRRAFKERALLRHPDRAGPGAAEEFQELSDAYHVLANPASRAAYDSDLRRTEAAVPGPRMRSRGPITDLRAHRPVPEPLIPPWAASLFRDFEAPHDVIDDTFSRLIRNFTGWALPKSERVQAIEIEVGISEAEAQRGASIALGLPTFLVCPSCDGAGSEGGYPCALCSQTGRLEDEVPVELRIRAPVRDGMVIEESLWPIGIRNAILRARIRIAHG
jgi:molecular chaperone DnaJ